VVPLDHDRLRAVLARGISHQQLKERVTRLEGRLERRYGFQNLTGNSAVMAAIYDRIQQIAPTRATVLLTGETGTGKELVASAIHHNSLRRDEAFVKLNCAALAEGVIESELFGHEQGAFTSATRTRKGRFEIADGGTLFLDEIGDLSPKGQGDLLRVLEDGTFRMVGGTNMVRVNVRVVAATNKRLQEAVAAGKFREDLLFRLQIVPIFIPPLRERAEDIPLLIESFVEHFTAKHKRRRKKLSPEAMHLCQRFPWPGNVRQLRNVIERLVLTCHNSTIGVNELPDFLRQHDQTATAFAIRPGMTLAEVEKLLIRQTLAQVTANREEAAKLLGISRRSLQYKLKQYGLLNDEDVDDLAAQSES
jgi:DNA-binding NtrC family response regulator